MKKAVLINLLIFFSISLSAQERPLNTGLSFDEQYAFISMTLEELIDRFGPPRAVATARGNETWQDDVVFQYTSVDFYLHINRVWQVQFLTTHGISHGNRKSAVLQILGDLIQSSAAQDNGDHLLIPVTGKNWPLMLRINFNSEDMTGQVTAIFLYRSDY